MITEIIKPSSFRNPDIIMGLDKEKTYTFQCTFCKEKVHLSYKQQIEHINGKGNLTETEYLYLKKHYNIGYLHKSHDGGLAVFDKISCNNCKTNYFTYVGISEPLNSVYHIQIQGIIKIE